MSEQHKDPAYTEEQATDWLGWLAYNMQQRDQMIFQIEAIQPSWLVGRGGIALHTLLTRLLWSIVSSLVFALILGLAGKLILAVILGLIVGIIVGLIVGLMEMMISTFKMDADVMDTNLRKQKLCRGALIAGIMLYGWIFGLTTALIGGIVGELTDGIRVGPIGGLGGGLMAGLTFGLTIGLIFGFIRTSRVTLRAVNERLCTVESLQWSLRNARQNAENGLFVGLTIGLSSGLIVGLILGLSGALSGALSFGLLAGLLIGVVGVLIGGLIGGFHPAVIELKTYPNQGMWLTLRSMFIVGIPVGSVVGVMIATFYWNFYTGLGYGIVTTLIVGLWYGGLDVIEHGIIRLIIAWQGHAPLNYARFLDYAAEELNFLQKVGGGYVFIHRYLLEHFAEIAVEKGYVTLENKS